MCVLVNDRQTNRQNRRAERWGSRDEGEEENERLEVDRGEGRGQVGGEGRCGRQVLSIRAPGGRRLRQLGWFVVRWTHTLENYPPSTLGGVGGEMRGEVEQGRVRWKGLGFTGELREKRGVWGVSEAWMVRGDEGKGWLVKGWCVVWKWEGKEGWRERLRGEVRGWWGERGCVDGKGWR